MKHCVNLIAAVFSLSLFAQAVDADLPTEGSAIDDLGWAWYNASDFEN